MRSSLKSWTVALCLVAAGGGGDSVLAGDPFDPHAILAITPVNPPAGGDCVGLPAKCLSGSNAGNACANNAACPPMPAYPPGTVILGNKLIAPFGGFRAWFEVKLSNWDPNGDNDPPLETFQVGIDCSGYADADAPGDQPDLAPPVIPCTGDALCRAAFGESWAKCELGTCMAGYNTGIATNRPADNWCAPGSCLAVVNTSTCDYRYGGVYFPPPRTDGGIVYYGGTLVLDIPVLAMGTYTVNLDPLETFLLESTFLIPLLQANGFQVAIGNGSCCHGLGTAGASCNDNLSHSECDALLQPSIWRQGVACLATGGPPCGTATCGDNDVNQGSEQCDGFDVPICSGTSCRADCMCNEICMEEQKLTASVGATQDFFGYSVSIDGDTAVVGTPNDDDPSSDTGAAYVYVRSGGVWTEQAKLIADDDTLGDIIGASVSISGDTAVLGSPLNGSVNAGAAYVFTRSGTVWTQRGKLTASDAAADDFFGLSVSISGDTVVVGADFDDSPMTDAGSVYVFVKPPAGWANMTQTAKLTANDAAAGDRLGYSVSISGNTVVVGSIRDSAPVADSGSAYVFVRGANNVWDNGSIDQQAKLTAGADAGTGDRFGRSVSISGDTAVIGAESNDDAGVSSGSAYVFVRAGAVWTQQQKLTASGAAAGDEFGYSVSVSGNMAVVGAHFYNSTFPVTTESGAAYVFTRTGGLWAQQPRRTASDAATNDGFGVSVAVSGDTVVVGADGDDNAGWASAGAAYVFDCPTSFSPSAAPAPFNRRKNRYISFTPGSGGNSVAFRVQRTTAPTGSCWVQAPITTVGNDQYTATCGANPVFRVWTEPVIHVGDCEIIPVVDYEISATVDGVAFSPGMAVSTILLPSINGKLWADSVGSFNGTEWTPSNQIGNVNDVLAILARIAASAGRPEFVVANLGATSSADSCLNNPVNTADVLAAVAGVAGASYGPPTTGRFTTFAQCAAAPSGACLCCGN